MRAKRATWRCRVPADAAGKGRRDGCRSNGGGALTHPLQRRAVLSEISPASALAGGCGGCGGRLICYHFSTARLCLARCGMAAPAAAAAAASLQKKRKLFSFHKSAARPLSHSVWRRNDLGLIACDDGTLAAAHDAPRTHTSSHAPVPRDVHRCAASAANSSCCRAMPIDSLSGVCHEGARSYAAYFEFCRVWPASADLAVC